MKAEVRVVITYQDMIGVAKERLDGVSDTVLNPATEEINYDEDLDEWVVSWELKEESDE